MCTASFESFACASFFVAGPIQSSESMSVRNVAMRLFTSPSTCARVCGGKDCATYTLPNAMPIERFTRLTPRFQRTSLVGVPLRTVP